MLRRTLYALCLAATFAGVRASAQVSTATRGARAMPLRQDVRVRAPELEGGRGWLNTDKPLSIAALRGKVVLLDFWTYGCVNCMHIIPDLKRLEAKYANQLVVIGVHSAKFKNEKETENIRHIILRYGLEHPVVNDADFQIWQAYAVDAWPTLVLIDTDGYEVGRAKGEGHYEALDRVIGNLVEDARRRGKLNEQPLKFALERAKVGDLPLAFPGKVLADEKTDRLFIADSNHNRVVVTRLDGTLLYTIGSGARGMAGGGFEEASFHRPQGLALDGDTLYVADTENHLIRRVDLKARNVETVAGTGVQLLSHEIRGGPALSTPLSSPWDLQLVGRTLYIAMAGPHQIWKLDLDRQQLSVFAGTGREARGDGSRDEAAFAQPSGLASDGHILYVADAESNTIRAVSLGDATNSGSKNGELKSKSDESRPGANEVKMQAASLASTTDEVETLVGGDLFEFGDRDGEGDDVRLQHPLGLALAGGQLFITDTYNHKVKVLDPRARTVKTFAGTGKPGQADGAQASFYEPGGLSFARGRLYVADTNNHAVRVVDLATRQTTTLVIRGLEPPAATAPADSDAAGPNAETSKLAPQQLAATGDSSLVVDVALPAGYHVNPSAPNYFFISPGKQEILYVGEPSSAGDRPIMVRGVLPRLPLRIRLRPLATGVADLSVRLTFYYCREDNTGTCRIKTLKWEVPVEITAAAGAPHEIKLQGKVE